MSTCLLLNTKARSRLEDSDVKLCPTDAVAELFIQSSLFLSLVPRYKQLLSLLPKRRRSLRKKDDEHTLAPTAYGECAPAAPGRAAASREPRRLPRPARTGCSSPGRHSAWLRWAHRPCKACPPWTQKTSALRPPDPPAYQGPAVHTRENRGRWARGDGCPGSTSARTEAKESTTGDWLKKGTTRAVLASVCTHEASSVLLTCELPARVGCECECK